MNKKIKAWVAIILSLCMIVGLLPIESLDENLAQAADEPSLTLGKVSRSTEGTEKYYFKDSSGSGSPNFEGLLIVYTESSANPPTINVSSRTVSLNDETAYFKVEDNLSTSYSKVINCYRSSSDTDISSTSNHVKVSAALVAAYINGDGTGSNVSFTNVNSGVAVEQEVQFALTKDRIDKKSVFFEGTQHYYQFVPWTYYDNENNGLCFNKDTCNKDEYTWEVAYEKASKMTFLGYTGYLATIMNKDEDKYIVDASNEVGFLGGTRMTTTTGIKDDTNLHYTKDSNGYYFNDVTDAVHSGGSNPKTWYWACGPEIGTPFFNYVKAKDIPETETYKIGENDPYINWQGNTSSNDGKYEPSESPASPDHGDGTYFNSYECVLTTLTLSNAPGIQGTNYSWNDVPVNNCDGPILFNNYVAKGFFVEYGNRPVGNYSENSGEDISYIVKVALLTSKIPQDIVIAEDTFEFGYNNNVFEFSDLEAIAYEVNKETGQTNKTDAGKTGKTLHYEIINDGADENAIVTENGVMKIKKTGTVQIRITAEGDSTYSEGKNVFTINIVPKQLTWKWEKSLTYNGNGQDPVPVLVSGRISGDTDTECKVEFVESIKTANGKDLNSSNMAQDASEYQGKVKISGTHASYYTFSSTGEVQNTDIKNFTISPKSVEVNWSITTLVYNGGGQTATASIDSADRYGSDIINLKVTPSAKNGSALTNVGGENVSKNVGNYTATASISGGVGSDNYKLTNTTCDYTITQKEIDVSWPDNLEYKYDGTEKKPVATAGKDQGVCDGDTVTLSVTPAAKSGTSSSLSGTQSINVGEYTGTVAISGGTGSGNYKLNENADKSKDYKILKAAYPTPTPSASAEYTYDGNSHTPAITNIPDGATVYYKVKGAADDTYTTTTPAATNANGDGVNYVYKVVVDDNHEPYVGNFTLKINPKPLTIDWSSPDKFTYNKQPQQVTPALVGVLTDDAENVKPVCTLSAETGSSLTSDDKAVNVGEYSAIVTGLSGSRSSNYTISSATKKKGFTITIANITAVTISDYEGTYDKIAHGLTVTGDPTGYTITYSDSQNGTYTSELKKTDVTVSGTNTDGFKVFYKIEKENYETKSGSAYIKITKRPVDLVWDKDTFIYKADTAQQPKAEVASTTTAGEGLCEDDSLTFAYKLDGANLTGTQSIDVGDYVAEASISGGTGSDNYEIRNKKTQFYTIKKRGLGDQDKNNAYILDAAITPGTYNYKGSLYYATTTDGSIVVKDNGVTLAMGKDYNIVTANSTTEATDVATYNVVIEGAGNYSGTRTLTWTITPADFPCDPKIIKTYTYDKTEHKVILDDKDSNIPAGSTIVYTDASGNPLATDPARTDAGSTDGIYYIVQCPNYKDSKVYGPVSLTIEKRPVDLVWEGGSYVYIPDTEQKPSASVKASSEGEGLCDGDSLTFAYKLDGANLTGTQSIDVGDYVAEASISGGTGSGNYVIRNDKTKNYSIGNAGKVPGISAEGVNVVYDAKNHSITVKGTKTGDVVKYSTSQTGDFSTTNITRKDVTSGLEVFYTVDRKGYTTFSGSAVIVITPLGLSDKNKTTNEYILDAAITPGTYNYKGSDYYAITTDGQLEVSGNGETLAEGTDYNVVAAGSTTQATNVGTYEVVIEGAGNYSGTRTLTWTIKPVDFPGNPGIVKEFTYDQDDHKIILDPDDTTIPAESEIVFTDENGTPLGTDPSRTNAGSTDGIYYIVTNPNYNDTKVQGPVTLKINPRDIELTWGDAAPTYDGTGKVPTATGTYKGYDVPVNVTAVDGSGNPAVNAGTYTATATTSDKNYNITNPTYTLNIKPRTITIDWSTPTTFTYDGKDQRVTGTIGNVVTGDKLNEKFTYTDGTGAEVDASVDAGSYKVTASINNNNYELPKKYYENYTIVKKALDNSDGSAKNIEAALKKSSFEYDTTVINASADGNLVVSYNGMTLVESKDFNVTGNTATDVGSYSIVITAVPTSNFSGSVTLPWNIGNGKKIPGITVPNVDEEYSGKPYGLVFSGTLATDTISYGTSATGPWSSDPITYTDVTGGPQTVFYKIERYGYDATIESATINVAPKPVEITWDHLDDLVYTGSDLLPTVTIVAADIVSGEEANLNVTIDPSYAQSEIGTGYPATAELTGTAAKNYVIKKGSQNNNFNIGPKDVADSTISATLTPNSFDYTGFEIDPRDSEHNAKLTVTYENLTLVEGKDFTVGGATTATDKGTYNMVITGIGSYTGTRNVPWAIGSRPTMPDPVIDADPTYNGKPQNPVITNIPDGSTIIYKNPSTGEYDPSYVPTLTNVTDPAITDIDYMITNPAYDPYFGTIDEFKIDPKEIAIDWTNTDLTYTGEHQQPTATAIGAIPGDTVDITVTPDTADKKSINPDGYTAVPTIINPNYKLPSSPNKGYTIAPKSVADKDITATLTPNRFDHTGFPVDALDPANGGKLVVKHGDTVLVEGVDFTVGGTTVATNEGTYTMTVNGIGKYTGTRDITWGIGTKPLMPAPTVDADPEYNGTPQSPVITDIPAGSTVIYKNPANGTYDPSYVPTLTNVTDPAITNIDYMITNPAYDPYFGKIDEFKIDPKEVAINWGSTELVYNGEHQQPTATATGVIPGDTVVINVTPATPDGKSINTSDYIAVPTIVNPNYKLPTSPNRSYSIVPKPLGSPDITATLGQSTFQATGSPIDATAGGNLTVKDGSKVLTEGVDYVIAGGAVETEPGTYVIDIRFAPGSNYSGSRQVSWKISNKPLITGITDTPVDCTYDGQEHSIQVNGTIAGDKVSYSTNPDGPFSTDPITRKNATNGTEKIYYLVERDGYEPYKGSSAVTINPKEIGIDWTNTEPVYDGTVKTPAAKAIGLIAGDIADITVSGGAVEVGSYTAIATAISNPNYKLPANANTQFTIKPAGGGHVHVFDQKVISYTYLFRAGNCVSPSLYYYSCICGEKGTETFEYGGNGHFVYYAGVIKEPTYDEEGLETYHCIYCEYHYELPIPKLNRPEPTPDITPTPEPTPEVTPIPTPVPEDPDDGYGDGSLEMYKGYFKDFTTLVLTGEATGENSVHLSWLHHGPADYFIIKSNKCNTETETYFVKEIARVDSSVTTLDVDGLEPGRFYKFVISAWKYEDDGTVRKLGRSLLIDVVTDGGRYTNAEKVSLTGNLKGKKKVTLKVGQGMALEAEITEYQKKRIEYHINMALVNLFRYESMDEEIVKIRGNKMIGVKKGTTDVYVFAQNGAYAKITVTVK